MTNPKRLFTTADYEQAPDKTAVMVKISPQREVRLVKLPTQDGAHKWADLSVGVECTSQDLNGYVGHVERWGWPKTNPNIDWYEEALNGTLIQTADGIFLKTFGDWARLVLTPDEAVLSSKEIAEQGPPNQVLRYGWSENDD